MCNNKEIKHRERIPYFDLAKFVAIMFVVIGHSYLLTIGYTSLLREIIYSFHMPLFMIISGFFAHGSLSRPLIPLVKRKTVQLLLPVVSCTLLSIIFLYLCGNKTFVRDEIVGCVWFLKTLFLCYFIAYFSLKIFPNDLHAGLISCLFLLIIPGGGILKLNMMYMYFFCGYIFCKYYNIIKQRLKTITIISGVLFVLFVFTGNATSAKKITLSYIIDNPLIFIISLLAGLVGSLFVIGLCNLICNRWNGKLLEALKSIGKYTLGIYVIQILLVERFLTHFFYMFLKVNPIWISDYIITPFIGIVLTVISYGIVLILNKNKYINLLLFGNQY